jgi:hypothetical protein
MYGFRMGGESRLLGVYVIFPPDCDRLATGKSNLSQAGLTQC